MCISLGDFTIVKSLAQFMKKFHLVARNSSNTDEAEWTRMKKEISDFTKLHPNKVLYFQDLKSYTIKIKNALSK